MYSRYALYHCPSSSKLARFGAEWLGWDVEMGRALPVPQAREPVVARPAKYGFHATLKAPFRAAEGAVVEDVLGAVGKLATERAPVRLEGLEIARIGRFLALVPSAQSSSLQALGLACVTALDRFRAPILEAERARRKPKRLSEGQREMLDRWGYPYVGDEFRFHMTLTGPLNDELEEVTAQVQRSVSGLELRPYLLDRICLCGERKDGRFEVIEGFSLSG